MAKKTEKSAPDMKDEMGSVQWNGSGSFPEPLPKERGAQIALLIKFLPAELHPMFLDLIDFGGMKRAQENSKDPKKGYMGKFFKKPIRDSNNPDKVKYIWEPFKPDNIEEMEAAGRIEHDNPYPVFQQKPETKTSADMADHNHPLPNPVTDLKEGEY